MFLILALGALCGVSWAACPCAAPKKKKKDPAPATAQPAPATIDPDTVLAQRIDARLESARKQIADGSWQQVCLGLPPLLKVVKKDPQRKEIEKLLAQADAEGAERVKNADKLYAEKKYSEALKAYRNILATFGQRKCAVEAQTALDKAEKDPALAAALRAAKAQDLDEQVTAVITADMKARNLSAPATKPSPTEEGSLIIDPDLRFDYIKNLTPEAACQAVQTLQTLAAQFPQTPAGKQAISDLALVNYDRDLQTRLKAAMKDASGKRILAMARQYEQAGRDDVAMEKYREFLKGNPQADESQDVAKRIEALENRVHPE
ncbi:MAG: hypothetical protein LLG01_12985 [Planctomycetaceae bacterium]|nr:hypothetical protein [Planctomycetaceae bacterium]